MINKRDLAKFLYESYREAWGWDGVVTGGVELLPWDDIPEGHKICWEYVAERSSDCMAGLLATRIPEIFRWE